MLKALARSLVYLLEPIGLAWGVLVILTLFFIYKRRWRLTACTGGVALFLSLIGSTGIPGWMLGTLERVHVRQGIEDLPVCDAVVVLGGAAEPSRYDAFGLALSRDADRPIMAMELMRLGKGNTLIVGGAGHPISGGTRIESDLVQRWFTAWKLTDAPIESLGACDNTYDEAVKTAKIFRERGWKQVILVTSAYHMPRAAATFRTQGVPVICVACDYKTSVGLEGLAGYSLVPRYQGFAKVSLFVHEKAGWFIYRWKGWIDDQAPPEAKSAAP